MDLFFLYVEGEDDERFFEQVFAPMLDSASESLKFILYAEESKEWRKVHLETTFKTTRGIGGRRIIVGDQDAAH